MIRVALRGLAWRKIRGALTATAIVLGVAMVSGAFILTDTMKKAADNLQTQSYAGIDGVVTGKASFTDGNSFTKTPAIPQALVGTVQGLPQVGAAVGTVLDQAKLVDANGRLIGQAPNFAVGIDASSPGASGVNPLTLGSGRWAVRPGEIAIDAGTARRQHLRIGDTVGLVARGPLQHLKIVGFVKWGDLESLGTATMAAFDLRTAQTMFGKRGQVDTISIAAKTGMSANAMRNAVRAALPASTKVQTAMQADPFDFKGLQGFVKFIKIFLLAFGGIALFVGAFIIFNTFSITVAQRTREFGLLRTIGASRRQVLRGVMLEAFAIGLAATALGVVLGIGISKLLSTAMKMAQIDLPQAGMVFSLRTVLVSLLAGVVVTVTAGLVPAVRATRVPPVAVLREGSELPKAKLSPVTPAIAVVSVGGGFAALVYGMFSHGAPAIVHVLASATGVIAMFVGLALLAPRLVKPIAWAVGFPSARFGGAAGSLARENASRNPGRTAVTASALMIGLALVTFVTVLAHGVQASWGSTLMKQVTADYVLSTDQGFESFSPAAAAALAHIAGVEVVSSIRSGAVRIGGKDETVSGLDAATITRFFHFTWVAGSDATVQGLGQNDAIVLSRVAKDEHLRVGGQFVVTTPDGRTRTLVVRGIHKPAGLDSLLGGIAISNATYASLYTHPRNAMAFVAVTSGVLRPTLERALYSYPDVRLQTEPEFVDNQNLWIGQMLKLLYVLLGLSVLVSFFGIVNTLVLAIVERTRELGALRAVGMTRRQMRRMIRHESVITALIGATLGLALGVGLAALVIRRLSDYSVSTGGDGMHLTLPLASLAVFALAAIVAGIAAAALPARRASRLNVLSALQYE